MSFGPLPLEGFLDKLASSDPTPGGGTASAVAGAMACAQAEMVLGLTLGRPKFAAVEPQLAPLFPEARALRARLLVLADLDARAYDGFVAAMRLPKASPEQQAARAEAMQRAARHAAAVPLETARAAVDALAILEACARQGNPNARSDAVVGALLGWSAYEGARLNVLANLEAMGDAAHAQRLKDELAALGKRAEAALAGVRAA